MKIQNGFLDVAKTVPSPNKGGHINPTAIIVHDTAGALGKGSSVGWLTNPEAKASAHFVVERDGTISQLVSTNLKAWHAGRSELNGHSNVNNFSVGIEIVNPGLLKPAGAASARASFGTVYDRKKFQIEELGEQYRHGANPHSPLTHPAGLWMPYTEAQIDAVLHICLALRNVYPIEDIAPHWVISPGRKIDTNPLFPLAWLCGRVLGRQDPPPPQELVVNWEAAEGKAENPEKELETCRLKLEGKLHKWPSLFPENILGFPEDNEYYIIDNGMFRINGEYTPPELSNEELHWVKLRYAYGTKEAWTLFSNIERGPFKNEPAGEPATSDVDE